MNEIKSAIKRLSKSNTGFDALMELAIVKTVNMEEMTCSVVLFDNEDLLLEGVKLKPVMAGIDLADMGAVIFPEIDSKVIIGQINNQDTDLFVVVISKASKISLDAGSFLKLLLDLQSGVMAFELTSMVFNKGLNGGLPLVKPLHEKINQLERKLNDLISDFKSHKHGGVSPGTGVTSPGDKQGIGVIENITKLEELENTKIVQ